MIASNWIVIKNLWASLCVFTSKTVLKTFLASLSLFWLLKLNRRKNVYSKTSCGQSSLATPFIDFLTVIF